MSVLIGFSFIFLDVLLFAKWNYCMELDVCLPVRVDHHLHRHKGFRPSDGSDQLIVFRITAFKTEFYLNLSPDSAFIVPGIITPLSHSSSSISAPPDLHHCFYSGDVNADPSSYSALSLCHGLQGAFSYQGMDYFINRLGNESAAGGGHSVNTVRMTHVIRRLQQDRGSRPNSRCGVGPGLNPNISASLEKYKHLRELEISSRLTDTLLRTLGRSKRFASVPRFVEVLVVADESMAKFHGDDLTHYLLTLMSIAARLYKHASILNSIHLVVVGFVVINESDKGPKVSTNAALTLRTFCAWQRKLNKNNDNKHPEYWDTAILFTKQDLCGATTCDTLGMADVGTMCDPKRSCSVIEDDGLPSAFTTAHELGHVFNMPHDSVNACKEVFGKLKDNHMMSPTLIQIDSASPWSVCSAAVITDFLDRGHGNCLLNQPQKWLALPESLPGTSYSLHRQCELSFGTGSKPCPYMQPCSKLWCTGNARGQLVCQTRHFPWADGTSCGNSKLCFRGVCTNKMNYTWTQVDGHWGQWGQYGTCSRTCGGGVQLANRHCNDPVPEYGGKYCHGVRVKYRSCNLDTCPESGKSFREEQCEAFNGFHLNTNRLSSSVVWVPKYSGVSPRDKCRLICRANGTGYFYALASKVVDGTPCSPDTSAVCVMGKCIKAGCDGKIRSNTKYDKCGVCGGDNQNCKKVSGMFTKSTRGYNFVLTLPVGASNIDIRQRGYRGLVNDDNYLAMKNRHGKYLLNGNYVVSTVERDITTNGSLVRYSGTAGAVETLQATRPLQEVLTVELLSVGRMTPPRVRYTFYLSREPHREKTRNKEEKNQSQNSVLIDSDKSVLKRTFKKSTPRNKWTTGSWEKCTVSCGIGFQTRLVHCTDPEGRTASDCDSMQRPAPVRECGDRCPVWVIGQWSPCSKTCGRGYKRRLLHCITQTGTPLPREHCLGNKKPQELELCTVQLCKFQ
ncbi:hypothetical protein DPEC_G00241620 [Dallia pectoralis]|uniref:Uncharacterized protein n=1 Tax=Dallia pectoralis TaxID=75939 RepID=A0ACC2FUQ5_DALPE|nr:hypothetical protein DPEC_G00241620 [Dallia pectoralis]